MRQYGMAVGFVGLTFAAIDCFAETLRGAWLLYLNTAAGSVSGLTWLRPTFASPRTCAQLQKPAITYSPRHSTGKKDMLNGVLGGIAGGAVLGTAIGRMPVAVGAAALLAVSSSDDL